jgi:hypothetical protein
MSKRSRDPAAPDRFWFINTTGFSVGFGVLILAAVLFLVFGLRIDIPFLVGICVSFPIAMALAAQRVVVDADGVSVRSILGRRFIAHREIDRVHWRIVRGPIRDKRHETQQLVITLRSGDEVIVSTGAGQQIAASIRTKKYQRRASSESTDRALARGRRSTARWLRGLRALAPKHGSYRTHESNGMGLWNVVESRWTSPVERAAAAVALRSSLDESSRRRLRVVATETEDQALRILIEQAADEEASDEALAEALEQVERTSTR